MKNVLFITTSPTVGGNGDVVIKEAIDSAKKSGATVTRIDLRDKKISGCNACNGCIATASCVQKDDMTDILQQIKESDSIIITVPIYFNLPNSQAVTFLNRLFVTCTPAYKPSKNKKLGIMITCGGSEPSKMKELCENAVMFFQQVTEKQIVVFNKCSSEDDHCKNTPEFIKIAQQMGDWAVK